MTMSSFCAQPRIGYLLCLNQMYGYLINFFNYKICFHVDESNYEGISIQNHDWSNTTYFNGTEDIPTNASEPKGKCVVLLHYYNANLMHNILSGRSVTGCFHLSNLTPMMWFSKKQATSETATYGSEFLAARTCVEQIIDLRNSF